MPSVNVRFFGPARDLTGQSAITLEIAAGETVGALAARLAKQYERLGQAVGLRLAVNRVYSPLNQPLAEGDEIAVIPPVSGGTGLPRVLLTREPIDPVAISDDMRRFDAGAVVTFSGTVRAEAECARQLVALDYEAYEAMAIDQLNDIQKRVRTKFDVLDAAIIHRLGKLKLGETSILVVVSAAHRQAAFDACEWIVERVKTDVPIWKKDVWSDGSSEWVNPIAEGDAEPSGAAT